MPISLKLLALFRAVTDFGVFKPRKTKRYIPFLRLWVSAPLSLRQHYKLPFRHKFRNRAVNYQLAINYERITGGGSPPFVPRQHRKKVIFSSVTAGKRSGFEINSVGIRVRAVIKFPNDLEIHIRVSLTFRTVEIHHRFKKNDFSLPLFRPTHELLHSKLL